MGRPRSSEHPRQQQEQTLIFTYGTLKLGFPNHHLLPSSSVPIPCVTTETYPLVLGPNGIPFLLPFPGRGLHVSGEIYSVCASDLARIDDLEGVGRGHYERLPIKVVQVADEKEEREVMAYYAHRDYAERMWNKCGQKAIPGYTEKEAAGFVRVGDRPTDRTFLDEVTRFLHDH